MVLLALLTLQNAGQTLIIKLAQLQGSHPNSLVVMLFAEMVKVVASVILFFLFEREGKWWQYFGPSAFRRSLKLWPVAFSFALQNQLLFVAVHNLTPPVFQALAQLKILSAGIFSVLLLSKKLSQVQWTALILLACGAALVQMEGQLCAAPEESEAGGRGKLDAVKGFLACLASSSLSGLGGCYTELMLKTEKLPMWLQSAQVAFASTVILSSMITLDRTAADGGPDSFDMLDGFIALTWVVIAVISLGGLVVVAVLRYADNVLKGMSMVFALLLSGVASVMFFATHIGSVFCVSAVIICCSVFLYQHTPPGAGQSTGGSVAQIDGKKIDPPLSTSGPHGGDSDRAGRESP